MKKISLLTLVSTLLCGTGMAQHAHRIKIDLSSAGRTFEGIGGVSAGASSELLIDYPEPQRSEILDFLFKPNFGASLQQLKVEIGADAVVVGSEPSHARSMQELLNPKEDYYRRGYEFWLMHQAQSRNPNIILSALEWAAPGYLQSHWTRENADYIIQFILGAKRYWDIDMHYISPGKNESEISPEWLKHIFKPALDQAGLSHIKILAPDNIHRFWEFCELMLDDPELASIVDAVGYHYIFNHLPTMDHEALAATDLAKSLDCSLWASEDWSMHDGNWKHAHLLAGILNKMYIRDRVTAMQIWCPVDGYYDNLGEWSSTGLMQSDQPWSGHYVVSPAIWAAAHFTQFIAPGWTYLNSACDYFNTSDGGNFTTLISPDSTDLSTIIFTRDLPAVLEFDLPTNYQHQTFHLWHSNATDQFVYVGNIKPQNGRLTVACDSASIYSITTTTGQRKGTVATTPPAQPFPLPFTSDFQTDYAGNRTPRFFADIEGGFDLVKDDQNQFLEQQMVIRPINWTFYDHYNPQTPLTQIGDPDWTDCDLSVDVQIPPDAFAQIFVRVAELANYTKGYSLKLYHSGAWELLYDNLAVLGSGYIELEPEDWNQMGLKVEGEQLTVTINGKTLKTMTDKYATEGMAALGCSWHRVRFDNFSIHH